MRILILGARGMLGHRLALALSTAGHAVRASLRGTSAGLPSALRDAGMQFVEHLDVTDFDAVEQLLAAVRPEVVINCIGIIKQLASANDPLVAIPINAVFPHRLARASAALGIRMLHFSTDCVFSGTRGPYSEAAHPDPDDLYGRSKLLGEVNAPNCLTLRTSIIGHELGGDGTGLVSWILRNRGQRVAGYARALYTGVTTDYMASVVDTLLTRHADLCGVWQLSSDPISKYALVRLIDEIYALGMTVDRDELFVCDRRLDSSLLRAHTGIVPPDWRTMIDTMHAHHLRQQEASDDR